MNVNKQTIHLGSDHAGFELKEQVKEYLQSKDLTVFDHGATEYNDQDDYPDYVIPAVEAAVSDKSLAIIFGGSGQGEAMAANKVPGARATVYYGSTSLKTTERQVVATEILELSKAHNNANILSLGARFITFDQAVQAIDLWLESSFSDDIKYQRRIDKVEKYEK